MIEPCQDGHCLFEDLASRRLLFEHLLVLYVGTVGEDAVTSFRRMKGFSDRAHFHPIRCRQHALPSTTRDGPLPSADTFRHRSEPVGRRTAALLTTRSWLRVLGTCVPVFDINQWYWPADIAEGHDRNAFPTVLIYQWGRKKSFLLTITVSLVGGIGAAFPVTYEGYIAWRGVVGMTYPAIFQTPFIMSMEIMSPEKRTFAGMFVCAVYGVALMSLAGVAYLLRSWFAVAVATSLPFVVLLAMWWLIPESPRWLLSQNRLAEAEILVQKIAKRNGKKIPPNFLVTFMEQKKGLCCDETTSTESVTLRRLAHYPNLLKKVVVVCFSWTANTMVYNGLSFAVSSMGISDYVSFAISGAVEVPGVCLAWYFMDRHGRRPVMLFNMLLGGLACIAIVFAPSDIAWPTVALCSLGKLSITASFATIYVYGAELFPTVLRTFAMGIAAMVASVSLIITPHILYLGQIYGVVIPSTIFGVLSVAGGLAILLLPETMNVRLPQTLSEGEDFGKDAQPCSCVGSRTSAEDDDKQGQQQQERSNV
ncbi:hypothetical protein MTO96_013875 [Rhipicephalus appendiculatus]